MVSGRYKVSEFVDRLHGVPFFKGLDTMNSRLGIGRIPYTMSNNNTVKRRGIPVIREEMLKKGALLFRFKSPKGIHHPEKEHISWFKKMEALGFLVTITGCMLPYENFSGGSKGRPRGHKISALFFKGPMPRFSEHKEGWPTSSQVSHLCHRKECVNPLHLHYEPQWKNLKRNYCGENGNCDCGVTPKCICTYHNGDWDYDDTFITYDTENYQKRVKDLLKGQGYRFTILPKNHYESIDKRTKQRNETRSKRKRKEADSSSRKKIKKN